MTAADVAPQPQPQPQAQPQPRPQPPALAADDLLAGVPAAVAGYLTALNAGDPDAVTSWVAEDFVNEHVAAAGRGTRGRDAYRERLPGFFAEFTELRYEPADRPLVDADRVALPYVMTAVVAGRPLRVRGLWLLALSGGLVASRVDYWDSAAAAQPPSGGAGNSRERIE